MHKRQKTKATKPKKKKQLNCCLWKYNGKKDLTSQPFEAKRVLSSGKKMMMIASEKGQNVKPTSQNRSDKNKNKEQNVSALDKCSSICLWMCGLRVVRQRDDDDNYNCGSSLKIHYMTNSVRGSVKRAGGLLL